MVHIMFIAPMHSYVTNVLVYHLHITIVSRVYSHVTRMYLYVLVCARMLLVCYSYVFVCYSYVTRMYSYVTRMYSYVLVCYSYVTRMLLACSFSHDLCDTASIFPGDTCTPTEIFWGFLGRRFTQMVNTQTFPLASTKPGSVSVFCGSSRASASDD